MSGQFQLLRERRFRAALLDAVPRRANDNLFKFAFTLLATYHAGGVGRRGRVTAGFLIGAISSRRS
jgi:hypothetical protein